MFSFVTRDALRQLRQPIVRDEGALEWDTALLLLEGDSEQYIEKHSTGVATLHFRNEMDEATFLKLAKPWLLAAQDNYEEWTPPKRATPAEKVMALVRDLTGPTAIDTRLMEMVLKYGAGRKACIHVIPSDVHAGVSAHQVGDEYDLHVGPELQEGWQGVVVDLVQQFVDDFRPTGCDRHIDRGIREAVSRTDEFEAETACVRDVKRICGAKFGQSTIELRDLETDALGVCAGIDKYIGINASKLQSASQSAFANAPELDEETFLYLRSMEVMLHELGHAANRHPGLSGGFGEGYCWAHELEAAQYVIEHAETETEAAWFEEWAIHNLKSKHRRF